MRQPSATEALQRFIVDSSGPIGLLRVDHPDDASVAKLYTAIKQAREDYEAITNPEPDCKCCSRCRERGLDKAHDCPGCPLYVEVPM